MAAHIPKAIHNLVLDAGPIIKNEPPVSTLLGQAETLFTIPAVIEEIRDVITRSRVETTLLPFLTLRSPKAASIKVITDFARKTGDLEVLSRPDIHLMALAYELECERNHGDWRLRSVPGQKRLNGAPPTLENNDSPSSNTQTAEAPKQSPESTPLPNPEPRAAWGLSTPPTAEPEPSKEAKINEVVEACKTIDNTIAEEIPPTIEGNFQPAPDSDTTFQESEESEESNNEGWITPSNLKKYQAKDANESTREQEEPKTMQVATITTDFAMQNILLRMNLNLLAPSLQRIKQVKTWVLRCHACFAISRDMSKQFCGRCGKPTLLRTSCSTDNNGNFKVHLKKNMQWNTRGNVYSIPKPVGGSSNGKMASGGGKGGWGINLILAEDQKEYVQAMTSARRQREKDLMDEDYLPSILTGDRSRVGGRPKIEAGKNVNSRKRH